jgi:predicted SAM-dependent methyltransferase
MKLHLGCGNVHLDGYINIDAQVRPAADLVADVTKLDYPENSIDEIYLNAVFEHLWKEDHVPVCTAWRKMLKPGGVLAIDSLPDFDRIAKAYVNKERGIVESVFGLYDVSRYTGGMYGPKDIFQIHKDIFTAESIRNILQAAGFTRIDIKNVYWGNEPIDVNLNIRAIK